MANRFWIGGTGNWSDTAHWSTTSGGTGGAAVPDGLRRGFFSGGNYANDDVFFDANSFSADGQIVTLDVDAYPKNLDMTGVSHTFFISGAKALVVQGNATLTNKLTANNTGTSIGSEWAAVTTSGSITFSQNGASFPAITNFYFGSDTNQSINPTFSLGSDFNMPTAIFDVQCEFPSSAGSLGTFNTNSHTITAKTITMTGGTDNTTTGSLTTNAGTSIFNVGGFFSGGSAFLGFSVTFNGSSTTINLTPFSTIHGANDPRNAINITHSGVSGTTSLGTINVFPGTGTAYFISFDGGDFNIAGNMTWSAGSTVNGTGYATTNAGKIVVAGTFTANGTAINPIVFDGKSAIGSDSQGIISAAVANVSYVNVSNSVASGVASPFIDLGGTDGGNNTNWLFSPVADFTGTPLTGNQPLTVTFTDASLGSPTSWLWDFENNGFYTSTLQNPIFVYNAPGVYSVKLTASNSFASDSKTRIDYITVINTASNLYLQNIFIVGADPDGDVQTINAGKSDDSTPIYYELETQELDFAIPMQINNISTGTNRTEGSRFHLKKISDQIVVFANEGVDSTLEASQDGEYQTIPMDLSGRVNIGKDINLEGHYFTFKWSGNTTENSPLFEGILIENIEDLGMSYG